jgi:hypothetical protein
MPEVKVGYTTLKNKLHLSAIDSNTPNCGQGRMTVEGFVWSEEHPTSTLVAISQVYQYTLNAEHNYCKRCFPWHTEELA